MNLIFTCPSTQIKVQHQLERASARDHDYESVTCPACSRLHFLNCKTGKLLCHEKDWGAVWADSSFLALRLMGRLMYVVLEPTAFLLFMRRKA